MRHSLGVGRNKIMLLVTQVHIIALERFEDLDDRLHLNVGRSVLDDDLQADEDTRPGSTPEPGRELEHITDQWLTLGRHGRTM